MDLSALQELKENLITATDFQAVMNSFFDIAETPGFLDQGRRIEDPVLERIVDLCAQTALKKDVRVKGFIPVRIAEHLFTHGTGSVNGLPIAVIYFEDIDKGVISILTGGGRSYSIRFTKQMIPPGAAEMN